MAKKLFSILVAAGLVAGALIASPAAAAPEVPAEPNVVDPKDDANFLNDQDNAYGTPAAGQGDHGTPEDVSSATDFLAIWFSNTTDEVSLHFQTEVAPQNLAADFYFRFSSNAGEGSVASDTTRGCLQWTITLNGATQGGPGGWTGPDLAELVDKCNVGEAVEGKFVVEELDDGTGVTTITFPRTASPLLAPGGKITAPFGVARYLVVGPSPTTATAATSDTTKRGTDYTLVDGAVAGPPEEEPPGKSEPPGKKKGCDKGKGKKKGCKRGGAEAPPGLACDPFTPGEAGADQPTVTVTDAATEEAPVEQTVTLAESLGDLDLVGVLPAPFDGSAAVFNVQVDSAAADAGLYASIEFDTRRDYDLNLLHTDGSYAARSRGWNTFDPADDNGVFSAQGYGGASTDHSETLVGIKTSDCGGWTLRVENWLGEGGDFAVKLWLGEVQNDPQAEGEEPG
ncbi:MAG: hypothetical protein ACRDJI_04800 [Actinomycetota bacterium]